MSSEEDAAIAASNVASGQSTAASIEEEDEMTEVPFLQESCAYFVWLGFTQDTASALFHIWVTRDVHNPLEPGYVSEKHYPPSQRLTQISQSYPRRRNRTRERT